MRVLTVPKVLLLGAAGAYVLHRARRGTPSRRARGTVSPIPAPDPHDPVQELYSEVDDGIERDVPAETIDATEGSLHDTGDLYGVHVSPAEDTTHPDDDVAMQDGNNWIEALSIDSTEGGVLAEHEVEIDEDDEIDRGGRSTDTRDTPVADRGAGGPGGL